MAAKKLWTEAYRPKTLDGYVFQNEQQRDYQFKILDLIAAGNFQKVRDFVVENLSSEQIPEVIDFIYKNAKRHPVLAKDSNRLDQVIVILGEAEYRNNLTAIPHLNFEGMCIKIMAAISMAFA